MSIGKRLRFEVFKRDGFTCQYCGRTPPAVVLHCDHIHPVSDGGKDEVLNLVTACQDCNLGKSNVPLCQVTKPLAEMMEEAAERKLQVDAYNQFLTEIRDAENAVVASIGRHWFDQFCPKNERGTWVFGAARAQTIRTFLKKLAPVQITEAIDIALARMNASMNYDEKAWKYFCGVCWNKIRESEAN